MREREREREEASITPLSVIYIHEHVVWCAGASAEVEGAVRSPDPV